MTTAEFNAAVLKLRLDPEDFEERFVRSSGPGGQNVNKVSSAVMLVHRPTGIHVRNEESRSQVTNRAEARRRILERIVETRRAATLEKRQEAEKLRRQKAKRPRAVKERMLEGKRRRQDVKKGRAKVAWKKE